MRFHLTNRNFGKTLMLVKFQCDCLQFSLALATIALTV